MSAMKWLDNLLFVETLLGIHRNYSNQKKTKKYLIIFKICFQTILSTIVVSIKIYFLLSSVLDQANVMFSAFSALAYANLASNVFIGICYSGSFMSYYRSVSRVSDRFRDDKKLIKSLKRMSWSTIIITLLFTVFIIVRSLDVSGKFIQLNGLLVILSSAVQTIIRISIVYQYLMLYVVIMIVVNLSKCLISWVSVVQESVRSCDISSNQQCEVSGEQIEVWVELYRDLVNCCEKVTLCFKSQYLLSLALSIPNYILMINRIYFHIGLSDGFNDELRKVIIAILIYGAVTFIPIVAGQMARNQGLKFHRMLARLYNAMIVIDSSEAEAKLIKDLIRLIKKNPLEIKLVSKIPTGMYMLPVILSLGVNYLIFLLQFNHVI